MLHTHQISSSLHQSFLNEGREDPVTGDLIQSGNEVVLCAACGSAFLTDSWHYLGAKHCGQKETLTQVPTQKKLSLNTKWVLDQLIWKSSQGISERTFSKWIHSLGYLMLAPILLLLFATRTMTGDVIGAGFALTAFLAFSYFMYRHSKLELRKGKYSTIKRLEIFNNGLLVNRKKPIRLSKIERIAVKTLHNPRGNKSYYIYLMEIFLRDSPPIRFEPTVTASNDRVLDQFEKNLFLGLMKFSFYVPITFNIHRGAESSYLQNIKNKLELGGNFEVEVREK